GCDRGSSRLGRRGDVRRLGPARVDRIGAVRVNETPGLLRAGSVLRQTVRVKGRDLRARVRVAAFEPGQRLVLELLVNDTVVAEIFEIAPHEHGSLVTTSGTHELTIAGAALSGWRMAGLKRSFNARRAANLERLRVLEIGRAACRERGEIAGGAGVREG